MQKESDLIKAIIDMDLKKFKSLMNNPEINVNGKSNSGCPPLAIVIGMEKEFNTSITSEMIKLMIQHPDIDLNAFDSQGIPVITRAIADKREKTVELLINHPKIKST